MASCPQPPLHRSIIPARNYQPGSAHGSVPSVDISRPGHNQHSARASIAHQKLKGEVYPLPHHSVSKPPADASAAITAKPPPQTTAPTVNTKALPPHSLKHTCGATPRRRALGWPGLSTRSRNDYLQRVGRRQALFKRIRRELRVLRCLATIGP